ncbi:MAG: phosphopantothenoylcysteine decarboxylase, partial [Gemmatimonadota bacterium]|nr:phosphopantothenoylcysteine decarboxylase [Gemmatimonadota bacterium]
GRMGYALAAAAWRRGAEVQLISGPAEIAAPTGVRVRRVETAAEMQREVAAALPGAEVLIMAAAVADFRPASVAPEKLKKEGGSPTSLSLEPTDDVLASTRALRADGLVAVGFALETRDAVENGRRKLRAKGLDLLVANDATEEGAGFEAATNRVTLLAERVADEALPLLSKEEVAERILDRVERILTERAGTA